MKRTDKKLFALLMTLIMVVSLLSVGAFAADDAEEHVHSWTVSDPFDNGMARHECSGCDETTWAHQAYTLNAVAPTCTNTGLTEGSKCSLCGEILTAQEEIAALGHTEETVPGYAATCTEAGLTDGSKCSVCGDPLTAQEEIPELGHDYSTKWSDDANNHWHDCSRCDSKNDEGAHNWKYVDMEGWQLHQCSVCGKPNWTDHVDSDSNCKCDLCGTQLAHVEETVPGHAATCTEAGLTEGKVCSVCGETLTAQEEIPALGHDYSTEWNTTGETTHWHDCSRCDSKSDEAAHNWKYVDMGEGWQFHQCSVCEKLNWTDHVDSDSNCKCDLCGAQLAHVEETVTGKDPTCTETGLTDGSKCSVCGETLVAQTEIPALGHKNGEQKSDATNHWYECANGCGTLLEVTAHSLKIETVQFPGDDTPMHRVTCSVCSYVDWAAHGDGEVKNCFCEVCNTDLGHTEVVDEAVAATCTTDGKTKGAHCSACGETLVAQEIVPAPGHDWDVFEGKLPTCTEAGYAEYSKCGVCGEEKDNEVLPATGHTAAKAVKENEKAATCETAGSYDEVISCSACKEELSRETKTVAALGHKWDAGVVTKKPTATAKGETTYTCQNDKAHTKTAEIAALGTSGDAGLDNVPKTGDVTNAAMFGGMMIVALFGAIVTFFSAKKRNNH